MGENPWEVVTANGSVAKVQEYVDLKVEVTPTFRRTVRFYILKGVPVEGIIGIQQWRSGGCLWTEGQERGLEWNVEKQPHWRHPIVLVANGDYDRRGATH